MEWQDIDNMFRDYEQLCRKPPTTDEFVDSILRAIEDTKEIFAKYGLDDQTEQTELKDFDDE